MPVEAYFPSAPLMDTDIFIFFEDISLSGWSSSFVTVITGFTEELRISSSESPLVTSAYEYIDTVFVNVSADIARDKNFFVKAFIIFLLFTINTNNILL